MTFKNKLDEYINWCRLKLANKPHWIRENKYKNGYEDAMLAVMSMLHNEKSSADEWAKVKRAKWLKRQNEMTCSACKFIYYSNNDHFNYCPNCGARMEAKK